jgi:hypothetical protein
VPPPPRLCAARRPHSSHSNRDSSQPIRRWQPDVAPTRLTITLRRHDVRHIDHGLDPAVAPPSHGFGDPVAHHRRPSIETVTKCSRRTTD